MDSKEQIKKSRMKSYFVDAAKQIITEEGVESISIRNVADIAGYSYATLYNYFADLNDLLYATKQAMVMELVQTLLERMKGITMGMTGLKRVFRLYMGYYLENPNVFKFFYFHKLDKSDGQSEQSGPDFDAMMKQTFSSFVLEGKLQAMDVDIVGKTCIYAVHGMLTLFLSGNGELTETKLYDELDRMIDYLL